ncbi:MAG TPA: hypothetical protein VL147_06325 [Devosia sp.]|nr:hypothetical protein [Devosia sp.]
MPAAAIDRSNVGRIAERIVANELESLGWRVSDLNKDGLAANADLIAAKDGLVRQIQVKGASNKEGERWWFHYGYCTEEIIEEKTPVFNRKSGFYIADFVVLVAVRSIKEYRCIVLPSAAAESLAQHNMNLCYRTLTRKGEKRKPGKVWASIVSAPREHDRTPEARKNMEEERKLLLEHEGAWHLLLTPPATP